MIRRWIGGLTAVVLLVAAFAVNGCAGKYITAKDLVGVWHASDCMPSRWCDRYVFFADGAFRFAYNQMDEEKRTIDFAGTWRLDKNRLVLTVVKRTVVEGGYLVPASGSAGSEYSIENGTIVEQKVDPPEQSTLALGPVEIDKSTPYPTKLKIGDQQFWKWSDDPSIDVDH